MDAIDWEEVNKYTWRLRVIGGWLVWSNYINDNMQPIFIPDETHWWGRGN